MVISALFMNLNNAILKLLTEGLPPGEIMFLRAAMILPLVVVVALFRGGWSELRVYSWRGHMARAYFSVLAPTSFFSVLNTYRWGPPSR